MAKKDKSISVNLSGLKANYSKGYKAGDVIYRKYLGEWHIYVTRTTNYKTEIVQTLKAPNGIVYVRNHRDLLEALKRAARPFSLINDKIDNERPALANIKIYYDPTTGIINGHTLNGVGKVPQNSEEAIEERQKVYEAHPIFGTFLAALHKLTR